MYVTEWYGKLYGPFQSLQAAEMFQPPDLHPMSNVYGQGKTRELLPPRELTMGERQEKACFPNGR